MTSTPSTHPTHASSCWWNPREARWMCPADDATWPPAPTHEGPLTDVRDMLVVHTAMLREFRLASAAVLSTAPGDRRRARAVASHLTLVSDLLHHHHEGEDELLWPKLRDRTPPQAVTVIAGVESQHEAIDQALTRCTELREAWAAEPARAERDALAAQLDTLHLLLVEHLDLEEQALLPLAAAVLTQREWDAMGEAAMASMSKSVLPLVFGMFAYEGDPAVLTTMLHSAPLVPRTVLPVIAPLVYAHRAKAIHGSSRP